MFHTFYPQSYAGDTNLADAAFTEIAFARRMAGLPEYVQDTLSDIHPCPPDDDDNDDDDDGEYVPSGFERGCERLCRGLAAMLTPTLSAMILGAIAAYFMLWPLLRPAAAAICAAWGLW